LDAFIEDIHKYKIIVTYNGKCFDIPFIRRDLGFNLGHVHIDLRYVLKRLGYAGGLKGCEKQLGIYRGDLEGVDGYFAVLLWDEYVRNKNEKALETLLAYNIKDVVNLEKLLVLSYNMNLKETPFAESHRLPIPGNDFPLIPFKPDMNTIEKIKREHFL
jgi:uncharacterized protein YprB with RNaseH-like and TPR domain